MTDATETYLKAVQEAVPCTSGGAVAHYRYFFSSISVRQCLRLSGPEDLGLSGLNAPWQLVRPPGIMVCRVDIPLILPSFFFLLSHPASLMTAPS